MVVIVGLYLVGRAHSWFCNWSKRNKDQSWEQFEEVLCKRFGDQVWKILLKNF